MKEFSHVHVKFGEQNFVANCAFFPCLILTNAFSGKRRSKYLFFPYDKLALSRNRCR